MSLAEMFNPCRNSMGITLYEHWEQDSKGRPNLLYVSSTPPKTLDPGDTVVRRTYAPAGAPDLIAGSTQVPATPGAIAEQGEAENDG